MSGSLESSPATGDLTLLKSISMPTELESAQTNERNEDNQFTSARARPG
jgi:hypothetical protein